jgi:hypothetical protein
VAKNRRVSGWTNDDLADNVVVWLSNITEYIPEDGDNKPTNLMAVPDGIYEMLMRGRNDFSTNGRTIEL